MKRTLLLIVSIVPGVGPILLGRDVLGSLLLIGGLNFWGLAVIGTVLWIGPEAPWIGGVSIVLGVAASLGSLAWTWIVTSPRRRRRLGDIADRALELGLLAYLRGKLPRARTAVEAGLRGSRRDRDLLFLLFSVARESGDRMLARRLRRRLGHVDLDSKWEWELRCAEEARVRDGKGR